MSLRLLFVHGWAFTPAFWEPLVRELPEAPCHCLDLGFFGPERLDMPVVDGEVVAVGHSLGLLWLLREAQLPLRGVVSLGGFPVFTAQEDLPCGVSSTAVRVMRRGLGRGPAALAAVLETFHRNCGTPPEHRPDFASARPERLAEGLDWLLSWDQRAALGALGVPVSALAARDDAIVPPALTTACFAGKASRLEWLATGGHVFPFTQAPACARHIRAFLAELA